jgi:hypothetical protein
MPRNFPQPKLNRARKGEKPTDETLRSYKSYKCTGFPSNSDFRRIALKQIEDLRDGIKIVHPVMRGRAHKVGKDTRGGPGICGYVRKSDQPDKRKRPRLQYGTVLSSSVLNPFGKVGEPLFGESRNDLLADQLFREMQRGL